MTTDQRLIDAFDSSAGYEPSDDLWTRVVHSIEEDRSHRRRMVTTLGVILTTLVLAITVAFLATESGVGGLRIQWGVLEALEIGALVVLIGALGPMIRRFGRGYVGDIFRSSPGAGMRLLALMDVAYYLLFSGYLLLTTRLSSPTAYHLFDVGDQIEQVAARIAGLLLMMGLLHAMALMVMPLIGLVLNTTRTGTRLPRWVTVVIIIGVVQLAPLVPMGIGLLVGA